MVEASVLGRGAADYGVYILKFGWQVRGMATKHEMLEAQGYGAHLSSSVTGPWTLKELPPPCCVR